MSKFATNKIKETKTIQLTFTADGTAAAVSDVPVINAAGLTYGGLPTGVTLTSSPGSMTYAQLQDAFQKTPINITKITLRTANTTEVYGHYCLHGKIRFNGDEVTPEKIYLDGYATYSGGSWDQTLHIRDKGFLVSPQDFFTIPVKVSGATTIIIEYDYEADGVAIPTEAPLVVGQ